MYSRTGGGECYQTRSDDGHEELDGVSSGEDKQNSGKNGKRVDEQAHTHSEHVQAETGKRLGNIADLGNGDRNQTADTHRRKPETRKWEIT